MLKNNNGIYIMEIHKNKYVIESKNNNWWSLLNDIGCGELYYSKYFKDIYEKIVWDVDKIIQERNARFLLKKALIIYL